MKYAVEVKNKQEQDYVSMKLHNYTYDFICNYVANDHDIFYTYVNVINDGYEIISFNEFKLRYELKIGDTFEHNGFVCRVESEVKVWVYNMVFNEYKKVFRAELTHKNLTEITNKEFIKQLEENAR